MAANHQCQIPSPSPLKKNNIGIFLANSHLSMFQLHIRSTIYIYIHTYDYVILYTYYIYTFKTFPNLNSERLGRIPPTIWVELS